jgi:predicted transcriptional regulator
MGELELLIFTRRACRTGLARALRIGAGLSGVEVAAHVRLSASAISRYENGQRTPHGPGALRYGELLVQLQGHT